jgi:hypothetical protein
MFNSKMNKKQCRTCSNSKLISEFYRDKNKKDSYKNICKSCYKKPRATKHTSSCTQNQSDDDVFLSQIAHLYSNKDIAGLLLAVQNCVETIEAQSLAPGNTLTFHQDRILGATGYESAVSIVRSKISALLIQKSMLADMNIIQNRTTMQYGHIYVNLPNVRLTKLFITECMDTLYGKPVAALQNSVVIALESGMMSAVGDIMQMTSAYISEKHCCDVEVSATMRSCELCLSWDESKSLTAEEADILLNMLYCKLVEIL